MGRYGCPSRAPRSWPTSPRPTWSASAAPLAGALVYISQTRDVVVGGSALFAMAIGMSIPLMIIGLSAGSLLPRAGATTGDTDLPWVVDLDALGIAP